MYAPSTVPGIAKSASFIPSEYEILFCLAYETVDATELLNAAKRLSLAASVDENPKNVSTGTITNPPPSPTMDPMTPATKPSGKSHRYSSNDNTKTYFPQIKESRQPS
ncbi:protein of unknown function [Candidatus Nitrosotalea okcheonensis]|uniref:Uncharacterized protein n=1 Tax=Candidatus Nitrosotalea okcheonensis TaxID=1903276 RepID=A0A2H1FE56_9ARCH|nr:protein of unknown function [Candidatus Nitrosotalea okcheonensis]